MVRTRRAAAAERARAAAMAFSKLSGDEQGIGLASQIHVYGTICDLCIGSKTIVAHA